MEEFRPAVFTSAIELGHLRQSVDHLTQFVGVFSGPLAAWFRVDQRATFSPMTMDRGPVASGSGTRADGSEREGSIGAGLTQMEPEPEGAVASGSEVVPAAGEASTSVATAGETETVSDATTKASEGSGGGEKSAGSSGDDDQMMAE